MAPSAVEAQAPVVPVVNKAAAVHREPLQPSGALDSFEHFDVTPIIGREFPTANLVDWLNAPNSDQLLRDLAITSAVSQPYALLLRQLTMRQSPSAASSSSAPRTTSPTNCRRSSSSASES